MLDKSATSSKTRVDGPHPIVTSSEACQDEVREACVFNEDEFKILTQSLALARRQSQVLEGVLRGMSDKKIAAELGVAPPTVRTHLQKLFRRLQVGDRTELVIEVFREFRRLDSRPATSGRHP
ncbi:MAG: helix-turn-helix transcriptional regulator, partial [Planctomycetales bacterium]|nr:helix-turn-helix transcriptional regulator [Planctomycetales bacterium]